MAASGSGGLAFQLTRPNGSPDLLRGESSSEFSELSFTKGRTSRLSLSVELLFRGFMVRESLCEVYINFGDGSRTYVGDKFEMFEMLNISYVT